MYNFALGAKFRICCYFILSLSLHDPKSIYWTHLWHVYWWGMMWIANTIFFFISFRLCSSSAALFFFILYFNHLETKEKELASEIWVSFSFVKMNVNASLIDFEHYTALQSIAILVIRFFNLILSQMSVSAFIVSCFPFILFFSLLSLLLPILILSFMFDQNIFYLNHSHHEEII